MKTNESGRSMIEMLGVLGIIGVLTTSGIALYSKALYQRKVSSVVDQASELMTNIKNIYVSRRDYKNLDSEGTLIIKYKIVPNSMKVTTTTTEPEPGSEGPAVSKNTITHTMGGKVTFKVKGEGDDAKKFNMKFEGLDSTACVKLSMADWGETNSVCAKATGAEKCANKSLSATDAAKACACTAKNCYVRWEIGK